MIKNSLREYVFNVLMKEGSTRIYSMLFLFFLCDSVSSQTLPFRSYRVKDGLVSNNITAFYQDKKGYLWIGTSDGISVFDGIEMHNYTTKDGIAYGFVNTFVESQYSNQGMWIATNNEGVSRFKDGKFTTFRCGKRVRSNRVNTLIEDKQGTIWCGTDDGLFVIKNEVVNEVPLAKICGYIHRLIFTNDSLLWLVCQNGLFNFSLSEKKLQHIEIQNTNFNGALYMYKDASDNIWIISSDSTIVQFHNGKHVRSQKMKTIVTFLMRDQYGFFWIGSSSGLLYCPKNELDIGSTIRFTRENGMPTNSFNTCLPDREGNLWFGTEGKGIAALFDRYIYSFQDLDLTGKGVCDNDGHIWLSSFKGLYEFWDSNNGSKWEKRFYPNDKHWPGEFPFDLEIDSDGNLWAAFSYGGFAAFSTKSKSHRAHKLEILKIIAPNKSIPRFGSYSFAIDSAMRLWCRLENGGLSVYSTKGAPHLIKHFDVSDGLPENIRLIYKDRIENIWISGFEKGIIKIVPNGETKWKIQTISDTNIITKFTLRSMFQDSKGSMWFGTRRLGLINFVNGKSQLYTMKDGLLNDVVWSIAEGNDGTLWFGTETGIAYKTQDYPAAFQTNQELDDSPVLSCGVRKDGIVWVVTRYGLTLYNYHKSPRDTIPPTIHIARFQVDERDQNLIEEHNLSYTENNCRISFVSINFRNAGMIQYQYKLEGVDTSWSAPIKVRSVTFAALKPGSYTFVVRAINGEGLISPTNASIHFVIAIPYWQSWWFVSIVFILIASFVFLFVKMRIRRLLEIERIRANIAADLHDDIGSGLTRIALLSDVMHKQMIRPDPASSNQSITIKGSLEKVGMISRELVESMSDVVWSIDPKNDSFIKLIQRLKVYAVEMCEAKDIDLEFNASVELASVKPGSDVSRCVLLVTKEALNNVVKHSDCAIVSINFTLDHHRLIFVIFDNGKGFALNNLSRINGLENMRTRVEKVRGQLKIDSEEMKGTRITANIPLEK